ncbi:MAG: hypothetical protein JXQ97_07640 [Natronospirillum sp.]
MTSLWRYKLAWPWLLLDAAYLYSFTLTAQFAWLSYPLLLGLGIGLWSLRWWLANSASKEDAVLGLLCFVFPCATLAAQYSAARKDKREEMQQQANAVPAGDTHTAPNSPQQRPPLQRAPLQRRLVVGVVLVAFLSLFLSGLAERHVINPALAPLEAQATETLQRSLLLAAGSYASARLIDRAIAFFSEAQVGVGVASFKPGQVFKPVQDMAVRYSDVMVLAMTSIGIQLLVMEIGQALAVVVFGPALMVTLFLLLVMPVQWRPALLTFSRLFTALIIVMRLGIPLGATTVGMISHHVLDGPRQQAQSEVNITTEQLQDGEVVVDDGQGLLVWMRGMAGQASDLLSGMRQFSDGLIERLVQLLVIYTMETLILPLVMLYVIWRLTHAYVLPSLRTEWPY